MSTDRTPDTSAKRVLEIRRDIVFRRRHGTSAATWDEVEDLLAMLREREAEIDALRAVCASLQRGDGA